MVFCRIREARHVLQETKIIHPIPIVRRWPQRRILVLLQHMKYDRISYGLMRRIVGRGARRNVRTPRIDDRR